MYTSRGWGGGGVNSNAYKCVQGGRGGLIMIKICILVHTECNMEGGGGGGLKIGKKCIRN